MRQEIFYREALRMNLYQNDERVKRRLAQKMEFLSNDLSAIVDPPSDDKLRAYYNEHNETYEVPAHYSFYQRFFCKKDNNPVLFLFS